MAKTIVDWSLYFIAAVSVKALAFTLSISTVACSASVKSCLEVCLDTLMPSHMFTTWYLHPLYLHPLPTYAWKLNMFPINCSWSFLSCTFSWKTLNWLRYVETLHNNCYQWPRHLTIINNIQGFTSHVQRNKLFNKISNLLFL